MKEVKEKNYGWRSHSSGRQWHDQHHRHSRSNNAEEEEGAAELACSVPASRKMERWMMTRSSWGRPCPDSNRLLKEINANPVTRTMVGSWFRDKKKNNAHVTQDKDTKKGAQETQIDLEHNLSVVS